VGHIQQVREWISSRGRKVICAIALALSKPVRFAWSRLKKRRNLEKFFLAAPGAAQQALSTALDQEQISVPLRDGLRIYAIGDVHGRADLLEKLLDQIEADCADYEQDVFLVFLGDYIDRGFQSRQVIEVLLSDRVQKYEVAFLKGNHEEALLTFMSDYTHGPKWAAFGGRETLVSYGVQPPKSMSLNDDWQRAQDDFIRALPSTHQIFLLSLPTSLQIGPYGFVHAGLRPGVPFDEQTDRDRLWIRDEFLKSSQPTDVLVVHGHTPTVEPFADNRRINVDTGAYFTGRLTAVKLEGGEIAFLSTQT